MEVAGANAGWRGQSAFAGGVVVPAWLSFFR